MNRLCWSSLRFAIDPLWLSINVWKQAESMAFCFQTAVSFIILELSLPFAFLKGRSDLQVKVQEGLALQFWQIEIILKSCCFSLYSWFSLSSFSWLFSPRHLCPDLCFVNLLRLICTFQWISFCCVQLAWCQWCQKKDILIRKCQGSWWRKVIKMPLRILYHGTYAIIFHKLGIHTAMAHCFLKLSFREYWSLIALPWNNHQWCLLACLINMQSIVHTWFCK